MATAFATLSTLAEAQFHGGGFHGGGWGGGWRGGGWGRPGWAGYISLKHATRRP
jgi:hypothetical protein